MSTITELQAEVERLRDALQRERASSGRHIEEVAALRAVAERMTMQAKSSFDGMADAISARIAAQAQAEHYMAERNQARLQAQREVGEEVRKLRAERDELLAALREIAGEFAPGSGRQTYGPPAEAMDRIRDAARAAIARAEGGAA